MTTESAGNPSKQVGIRSLMISVMMSTLVAVVVFAVLAEGYLIPQMSVQDLRLISQQQTIDDLVSRVSDLEDAADARDAAAEAAAAKAPAAPAPAPVAPAAANP